MKTKIITTALTAVTLSLFITGCGDTQPKPEKTVTQQEKADFR